MLLGYLVAAIFVGDSVLERVGGGRIDSAWWRALFLLLALVAIAIVKKLPVVDGLIVLVLFFAGIGAFTMRSWQRLRLDADALNR